MGLIGLSFGIIKGIALLTVAAFLAVFLIALIIVFTSLDW